jgi:hypothetical protein
MKSVIDFAALALGDQLPTKGAGAALRRRA